MLWVSKCPLPIIAANILPLDQVILKIIWGSTKTIWNIYCPTDGPNRMPPCFWQLPPKTATFRWRYFTHHTYAFSCRHKSAQPQTSTLFFKTPNEQQINIDNLFADLVFDKLEINYYLFNRFRFVCFCLEREVGLLIYSVSENKWKCFHTEFIYLYKTYYKYLYI